MLVAMTRVERRGRDLEERSPRGDARVAGHDVQATPGVDGDGDEGRGAVGGRDVRGGGRRSATIADDAGHGVARARLVAVVADEHRGTRRGERDGDPLANTRAGAGDDRDTTLERPALLPGRSWLRHQRRLTSSATHVFEAVEMLRVVLRASLVDPPRRLIGGLGESGPGRQHP